MIAEKEIKNSETRIVWIDLVKSLAIILVIFCHAVEGIFDMNVAEWNELSSSIKLFRTIFFTIGRLGVPFFLFVTGKFMLSKKIENTEDCKKFYIKKLLPLLIVSEIWCIIYNCFALTLNGTGNYSFKEFILDILFLKEIDFVDNMWYIPVIIGIYIAIPFVNIIVNKIDFKLLKIPMILVFLASFLFPNIGEITNILFNEKYNIVLNLAFLGGEYGLYILLGYYISQGKFKKIQTNKLIIVAIASFMLTCIYQMWIYNNGVECNIWYNSAGILITSACIFEMFSRLKIQKNNKICTCISMSTLGIFFVHIIVRDILVGIFNFNMINKLVSVFILFILISIITSFLVWLLGKNKILREKILFIRS